MFVCFEYFKKMREKYETEENNSSIVIISGIIVQKGKYLFFDVKGNPEY